MPNKYHRPSPTEEGAKWDPEHASPVIPINDTQSDQLADIEIKESSSSASDSSDSGIGSSSSDGSPERKNKGKKRYLPFCLRSSSKTGAKRAEDEGTPDGVLEVWFAGCHSGMWVHFVCNITQSN